MLQVYNVNLTVNNNSNGNCSYSGPSTNDATNVCPGNSVLEWEATGHQYCQGEVFVTVTPQCTCGSTDYCGQLGTNNYNRTLNINYNPPDCTCQNSGGPNWSPTDWVNHGTCGSAGNCGNLGYSCGPYGQCQRDTGFQDEQCIDNTPVDCVCNEGSGGCDGYYVYQYRCEENYCDISGCMDEDGSGNPDESGNPPCNYDDSSNLDCSGYNLNDISCNTTCSGGTYNGVPCEDIHDCIDYTCCNYPNLDDDDNSCGCTGPDANDCNSDNLGGFCLEQPITCCLDNTGNGGCDVTEGLVILQEIAVCPTWDGFSNSGCPATGEADAQGYPGNYIPYDYLDECSIDANCTYENGICVDGVCQCAEPFLDQLEIYFDNGELDTWLSNTGWDTDATTTAALLSNFLQKDGNKLNATWAVGHYELYTDSPHSDNAIHFENTLYSITGNNPTNTGTGGTYHHTGVGNPNLSGFNPTYAIFPYDATKDYVVPGADNLGWLLGYYNGGSLDTWLTNTGWDDAATTAEKLDDLLQKDGGFLNATWAVTHYDLYADSPESNDITYLEAELAKIISENAGDYGYTRYQYDIVGDGNSDPDYAIFQYDETKQYVAPDSDNLDWLEGFYDGTSFGGFDSLDAWLVDNTTDQAEADEKLPTFLESFGGVQIEYPTIYIKGKVSGTFEPHYVSYPFQEDFQNANLEDVLQSSYTNLVNTGFQNGDLIVVTFSTDNGEGFGNFSLYYFNGWILNDPLGVYDGTIITGAALNIQLNDKGTITWTLP